MNWENAFHPHARISGMELDRVVAEISCYGFSTTRDAVGRITDVLSGGRSAVREIWRLCDYPRESLPKALVASLDAAFPTTSLAADEPTLFG